MALEKTWRWFGPNDSVKLTDLKQMGVEGVVTSLHHIPSGELWPIVDILEIKQKIESVGLRWSVVESLPVSEGIKQHTSDYDRLIENYRQSLINLGKCGINTVCYNFMPALDWARTDLHYSLPSGGEVMFFDLIKFITFDVFILERPGASREYMSTQIEKAKEYFSSISQAQKQELAYNIIVYTQGFIHGSIDKNEKDYKTVFLDLLSAYNNIDKNQLRNNLSLFLNEILPVAEKHGINMCIHPDDPPFPLLGLPRIVSTKEDLEWIFNQNASLNNGLTFCSGSFSARKDNKLEDIVKTFGNRIHFCHLRNNQVSENGNFYESGHIDGDVNLPALIELLLLEQRNRIKLGRKDFHLPVRPDHGIKILDDFNREAPPGYPLIGRFAGLMEIKGIEAGIEYFLKRSWNLEARSE